VKKIVNLVSTSSKQQKELDDGGFFPINMSKNIDQVALRFVFIQLIFLSDFIVFWGLYVVYEFFFYGCY
jgi:hypothetical protein